MFFHLPIFLYSLIFFLIFEFFNSEIGNDFFSLISERTFFSKELLFFVVLVFFFQISRRVSKKITMTPIPILLILSSYGLLYFTQSYKQQQILIVLYTVTYYFLHLALYRLRIYEKDQTAHSIIASGAIATIFLFYATTLGIYMNFNIPLWMLIVTLMLVTFLASFQYFWTVHDNGKDVMNFSLVLGLVMAEIVWVLSFWPFGYLTTGVITLIFYYVFWDLVKCHFSGELSKKRVFANMVIFGLLAAIVLSSTKWLPVV